MRQGEYQRGTFISQEVPGCMNRARVYWDTPAVRGIRTAGERVRVVSDPGQEPESEWVSSWYGHKIKVKRTWVLGLA